MIHPRFLTLTLCFLFLTATQGQSLWEPVERVFESKPDIQPEVYRLFEIDFEQLKTELIAAAQSSHQIFQIPDADGGICEMTVSEVLVMDDKLQQKFPNIRTFRGSGIGKYQGATIALDFTHKGFHAQILLPKESFYIDPFNANSPNLYVIYSRESFYSSNTKTGAMCEAASPFSGNDAGGHSTAPVSPNPTISNPAAAIQNGSQLRKYKIALACTGEYSQYHGGTVEMAMSAMTTTLNRVNGIFERDLSIRMVMVENNDLLVQLNPGTDPYTNSDLYALMGENQTACNEIIGNSNYDLGHVFCTTGGGVAYVKVVCNNFYKGQGVSGSWAPVGDPFDVDLAAHELGHQFGGNHTFNNSCGGNRNAATAYEPGSGSTVMSYAGVCAPNIQFNSDPYFHNHSLNEIYDFTVNGTANNCAAKTTTGNSAPVITLPSGGFYIPKETPFELTGTATDADGDILTYSWEQYDLGPGTGIFDPNLTSPSGNAPIFRAWEPSTNPTRVFPQITDLVNNSTSIGELLPTYARKLTFKLTVRDNAPGAGGMADAKISFDVANLSGPFKVTTPNTAVTWTENTTQTVNWDVANTNLPPVNCSHVDIFLSTDGGFTYPYLLAAQMPNNGAAVITVPQISTTTARVKVKASNNIFFDISNQDFTIQPADPTAALHINFEDAQICSERTVTLQLFNTQTLQEELTTTFPISTAGSYDITDLPTGSFNIRIKVSGYLAKTIQNVVLQEGSNILEISGLKIGDINNDNNINILDFSLLSMAMFSTLSTVHYNPLADLNCDGAINVLDFSIFAQGFGVQGD